MFLREGLRRRSCSTTEDGSRCTRPTFNADLTAHQHLFASVLVTHPTGSVRKTKVQSPTGTPYKSSSNF